MEKENKKGATLGWKLESFCSVTRYTWLGFKTILILRRRKPVFHLLCICYGIHLLNATTKGNKIVSISIIIDIIVYIMSCHSKFNLIWIMKWIISISILCWVYIFTWSILHPSIYDVSLFIFFFQKKMGRLFFFFNIWKFIYMHFLYFSSLLLIAGKQGRDKVYINDKARLGLNFKPAHLMLRLGVTNRTFYMGWASCTSFIYDGFSPKYIIIWLLWPSSEGLRSCE